jgi:DNA-directed RNA polymerase specialized sigma24 family protein
MLERVSSIGYASPGDRGERRPRRPRGAIDAAVNSRRLRRERRRQGIDADQDLSLQIAALRAAGVPEAKARGQHLGRRHTLRPNQRAEAARLHLEEGKSIGQIAALFGCGRTVVHRAIHAQQAAA